ncbi:MAG: transporter [Luteolibacter sp.]
MTTLWIGMGLLTGGTALGMQRDLTPDRPDTTECPITVEPGVWQIETSLWEYNRDESGGVLSESWIFGQANLKFGLTPSDDLQFVFTPWEEDHQRGFGIRSSDSGAGDVTLRWKHNLWGNDGGESAMALMPFVNIPTQTAISTGEWEGGLIAPLAFELGEDLGLTTQLEIDRTWDADSGSHHWELLHSASLGFDFTDSIGAYVEYIGIAGDAPYQAIASTGLTWAVSDRLMLDVGVTHGLTDSAPDFSIFQGLSYRF